MKSQYVKPEMVEEKFLANKYCVNCSELGKVTYAFVCNAPRTDAVYLETNGQDGLQKEKELICGKNESIFGHHHTDNCYKINANPDLNWSKAAGYSGYHPCGDTHTITVPKGTDVSQIFLKGYLDNGTQVVVWKGANSDNVHCMTALNPQDVPVTKS